MNKQSVLKAGLVAGATIFLLTQVPASGKIATGGNPGFDSDSVRNSDANQWRWLSYPGSRLTLNPVPGLEAGLKNRWVVPPIQKDLRLDLGGFVGTKSFRLMNLLNVAVLDAKGNPVFAKSKSSAWYPYKITFDAGFPGDTKISGCDFFPGDNDVVLRKIDVSGTKGAVVRFGGAIPAGMEAKWDPAKKALVCSGKAFSFALGFVRLEGEEGKASKLDAQPQINGQKWSVDIPLTAGRDRLGIAFAFGAAPEGEKIALQRLDEAVAVPFQQALANAKKTMDGYLAKVPAPNKWGFDQGGVSISETEHRRAYYAAWAFMVQIPAGIYESGSIELKSNVTLYLGEGSVLRGSENLGDYPPAPFRHNELGETRSLLWAIGRTDVQIIGSGMIDLRDKPFMDWDHHHTDSLSTGIPFTEKQKLETTAKHLARPTQPIFFHECERVRVSGVTIRNSPCWTITASLCRDIKISDLSIENNLRAPNSDGLHFCGSKEVVVTGCVFSCGDDCIAVTGITDWQGISENIVISNCTMRSRSAAIRFGHLASKVRSVAVSNLTIHDSNRGIAVFAGDDGWVKDLLISNIVMNTRIVAGGWWGKGEPLVIGAAGTGTIAGVTISQVRAESENGIVIAGKAGNIRDIQLRDWVIKTRLGENRALFKHMFDVQPATPVPSPDPEKHIPGIYAEGVDGLRANNIRVTGEQATISSEPLISNSSGVTVVDCQFSPTSEP